MKLRIIMFILFAGISLPATYGQQPQRMGMGGTISGKVLDEQSNHGIEYSNVVLFNVADSAQVTGTVTNPDGEFELTGVRPGKYYVDVLFMGYERKRLNVELGRGKMNVSLGEVKLAPTSISLDNVVVQGERAAFSYQIDKKVISADKIATALSGTAAEVLESIPSVTVDIEGNVSLRGSGSFTVLIDGRPTILDPQDALQQIPASSIESMEIITNPSAKYDPEGVSGIINVILKKNQSIGMSGLVNMNAGLNDKYGGEVLTEIKTPIVNATFGIDYNKRVFEGENEQRRRYDYGDTLSSYINTIGDSRWGRKSFGFRANFDFMLSGMDVLGIGGRYGAREMLGSSTSDRLEFTSIDPAGSYSIDRSSRTRNGRFFSINTNYQHKFDLKGHELNVNADYGNHNPDEESLTELIRDFVVDEGKKNIEDGPSGEFEYKIDYTLPISETGKFEAGTEGELENSEDNTELYEYDLAQGAYILQERYSQLSKSLNREMSVYSIYSNSFGFFGYQLGVRGEYTYRQIELPKTGNKFNVDRWDYFPTLHFSYNFPSGQQVMLSYTRRINRPGGWALEPFETWADANTVRRGNPGLQPEFVNSYEAGAQTIVGIFAVSAEVYYRTNSNKIEHVRSGYETPDTLKNISLITFENIGSEKSLGGELLINYDVFKFWSMDLMGNLYNYSLEGAILGEPLDKSSFNWRVRTGNQFKFPIGLQFQINAFYNSPSISSQGDREGFFSVDLAVKKEFMDRQLSLTLQARNLINTAKDENTTTTPGYYSWSLNRRESPMMMLNLRYAINNFKQQDRDRQSGGDNGEGGGGEEF